MARSITQVKPNPKVHLSTALLLSIGVVDLVSTLAWISLGQKEGNPLFQPLLAFGPVGIVLGKAVFLAGPIALLEFARKKNPLSAEQGTWVATGAYVGLWGLQIARLYTSVVA